MRKYLTTKHKAQSEAIQARQQALDALRDMPPAKDAAKLFKVIKDADAIHTSAVESPDTWECSNCQKIQPNENNHVAIEMNQVTAPRGNDAPLIKDYPTAQKPYLYLCRACALIMKVVTQKELDTGIREGRFLI